MNPTQNAPAGAEIPKVVIDKDILQQAIQQTMEQMEANNPYGIGKYTDEDAAALGIDSLGSLRLAKGMFRAWYNTPFIPDFIMKSPNPEGTFVACVVRGKELGFKMLEALASLFLSPDGRLGMYGTAMLALMRRSGVSLKFTVLTDDDGDYGMEVYGKRKDSGDDYTARFTTDDAARAGLIDSKMQTHKRYPVIMCKWRAVSDLFRSLASDLSGGPVYTKEELLEDVMRETLARGPAEPAAPSVNPYAVGMDTPPATAAATATAPPVAQAAEPTPAPPVTTQVVPATQDHPAIHRTPEGKLVSPVAAPSLPVAAKPVDPPVKAPEPPAAAVAPSPAPIPAGAPPMDMRVYFQSLTDILPQENPTRLQTKFQNFLKGFMGVTTLPKGSPDIYRTPLRFLEGLLRTHPNQFLEDPAGTGRKIRALFDLFGQTLDKWGFSDRCKAVAREVIFAFNHVDSGGTDTIEYLSAKDGMGVEKMQERDAYYYMLVATKTKMASNLPDMVAATGKSVYEIINGWGIDINTAPVAGIEAFLKPPAKAGPAAPEPTPVPEAAPEPPPVEEEGGDFNEMMTLFGNLAPTQEYPG